MKTKISFGFAITEDASKNSHERCKISFDGTEEAKIIFDPTGDEAPKWIKLPISVSNDENTFELILKFKNEADIKNFSFSGLCGNKIKAKRVKENAVKLFGTANSVIFIKMNTQKESNLSVFTLKAIER